MRIEVRRTFCQETSIPLEQCISTVYHDPTKTIVATIYERGVFGKCWDSKAGNNSFSSPALPDHSPHSTLQGRQCEANQRLALMEQVNPGT